VEYLFVLLIAVVVLVLAWTWWSARSERDPASSVDTFSRALNAMQPSSAGGSKRPAADDVEDTAAEASDDVDAPVDDAAAR
jgi:predicted negative regulator of RcsB-dependent stress response